MSILSFYLLVEEMCICACVYYYKYSIELDLLVRKMCIIICGGHCKYCNELCYKALVNDMIVMFLAGYSL